MDRWGTFKIICAGGMDESQNLILQGESAGAESGPGGALLLQNYEQDASSGYKTILGYSKYSTSTVPGSGGVLGVKVALGGVIAARGDNVYFSSGTGWGSPINTSARAGVSSAGKYRFIDYIEVAPRIVMCDGVNHAALWNGTTYTLINGSGAPTNPSFAAYHKYRLVLSGYSANRAAISISAPNHDTNFQGSSNAIELAVGDEIVGLKSFREILYIFCKRSIKKLVGDTHDNFAIQNVTDKIGCIATDSIQEVGGDVVFLAPDGIRSLAGTERNDDLELSSVSRPVKRTLDAQLSGRVNNDFSAMPIQNKSQYRLFIYNSTAIDSAAFGLIGKLNLDQRLQFAWSLIRGMNVACCDSGYIGNIEYSVFGHPSNGYVYRQESGNTFDGALIPYVYVTPFYTIGDETLRKVLHKINMYVRKEGIFNMNISPVFNYGDSNTISPPTIQVNDTQSLSIFGTGVYGTSVYSGLLDSRYTKNLQGSFRNMSLHLSSSNVTSPHKIDSIHLEFALKGRR